MSVPRDPAHYWPTDHATVRKKERDFDWPEVADVIQHGSVYDWDSPEIVVFHSEELTVPANHESGAIITVCTASFREYLNYVENDQPVYGRESVRVKE